MRTPAAPLTRTPLRSVSPSPHWRGERVARLGESPSMGKLTRLLRNFAFTAGLLVTVALVIMAIAAPLLSPFDPNAQDTARRLEAPSHSHLLGLDDLGRDG